MNKNICIVVQNYYEIAPRIRTETRALVEEGYKVDVISLRWERGLNKEYELDGARIITVPITKKRAAKWRYIWEYVLFFIYASWILSSRMLRKKYAFVQICNLPDFLVFSAIIPKILGANVIFDMVEIMPEFYTSKYRVEENNPIIILLRWQERFCTWFADKVIAINDPIKELLISRGVKSHKISVVMNSADEKVFVRQPGGSIQNTENGKFILMYHGTLTYIYGLDIAIKAFKHALEKMVGAEFWIIGDGPELDSLKSLTHQLQIFDRVKFFGVVPQQEIPAWLMQCAAGVLATRQDQFLDLSFSSKLPEYILMGKPVLMSRIKSIRYYFREESLAFFEPHNIQELSQRMIELYTDPKCRDLLVDNASSDYQKINWEIMRERYLNVYRPIVKRM